MSAQQTGSPAADADELKRRYEQIATSKDHRTTACDYQLRELEIATAMKYIRDRDRVLDIGCGLGYAVFQYAKRFKIEAHGIDYAENMIKGAKELSAQEMPGLCGTVELQQANVLSLPYGDGALDVVTSSRCLMALLDWEMQKKAIQEVGRVLKPGGVFVMMEGTQQGLDRLNKVRGQFGLGEIEPSGRDRLFTLKFDERELIQFCLQFFELDHIQRFGMYYFLSRVVHPLLVAPEKPTYDAKINEIARQIAEVIPDFQGLGHLVAFIWRKRKAVN